MVACSPACSLAYSFLFASNACSHDREHVLTAYSECIRHSSSASCFGPLEQKTICSFMSDLTLANAAIWNRAGIAPEACMPSQPFPAFAWSTVRHSRVRARTVITNSGAAGHSAQPTAEPARHTSRVAARLFAAHARGRSMRSARSPQPAHASMQFVMMPQC